jgi:hypothetical protein
MQTFAVDADVDVSESPEPTQRRTDRNEEVLAAIQQNLLQLGEAFGILENSKAEEQKLATALEATCTEEKKVLLDESVSEKQATERLLKCRALRDVQAARVNNAKARTGIATEDVLEFGRIVRRNCTHLAHALLQARLLQFMDGFLGPAIDHGLPITSVALVEASRPYKELLYFANSVHMESRNDAQQELSELATELDRWFAKLKSFVETEPDLDLACVYLGKD